MNNNLDILIEKLKKSVLEEDFIDIAYDITEELEENPDAINVIEPLLILIENNPDVDFGTPGPLVHFVERFYKNGYEEKLVESLRRKPTRHTIWMLNRIINDTSGERKLYYLNILKNITAQAEIDENVLATVQDFMSLHKIEY